MDAEELDTEARRGRNLLRRLDGQPAPCKLGKSPMPQPEPPPRTEPALFRLPVVSRAVWAIEILDVGVDTFQAGLERIVTDMLERARLDAPIVPFLFG